MHLIHARHAALLSLMLLGLTQLSGQGVDKVAPGCEGTPADSTTASVVRPKYLSGPQPRYPRAMLMANKNGEVGLEAIIGCDGKVDSASVRVTRFTDSVFASPAMVAIIHSQFSPATLNGRAVAYRIVQVVKLELTKGP